MNDHWSYAVKGVETVVEYVVRSILDENIGESRRRAHRLCIIDRAEVAALASIEAARLQGRTACARFHMLTYINQTTSKFYINTMIAHAEGDRILEKAWMEAIRLVEGEEAAAKGHETLFRMYYFPWRTIVTSDVPANVRARVDNAPDSGKPFQMSDRYSRHAWAYNILRMLYLPAKMTKIKRPQATHHQEVFRLAYEHNSTRCERAHQAAELYCKAGRLLDAHVEERLLPLRPWFSAQAALRALPRTSAPRASLTKPTKSSTVL
jgi:hypothetical protein